MCEEWKREALSAPTVPSPTAHICKAPHSSFFEQRYRLTEVGHVVFLLHDARPIDRDHVRTRLGGQRPEVRLGAALDADHVFLTALGTEARLVVVVEEAVEAGAVDEEILGSEDAEAPRLLASGVAVAGAEVGVEVGVAGLEAAVESGRVGLHVWCFGLQDPGVYVLRIGKFEIVKLAVFGARTIHPGGSLRFDQYAAAVVDVDLVVVREVELVVSDPHPVILQIYTGFGSNMQE